MGDRDSRIERLVDVARLYYEKDRTQNEIAEIYRISRPMVSKLLKEAKEEGIVKITIAAPGDCLLYTSDAADE